VHLVRFAPPVIEYRLEPTAPRDFSTRLAAFLEAETKRRWTIVHANEPGAPTLDQAETANADAARQDAVSHPLVQAILEMFPGAKLETALPAAEEQNIAPPPDWADFAPIDDAYEGDDE
jgi:DNA polymerase-3 subunit gamma/tau